MDEPRVFIGRRDCGCAVNMMVDTDQRLQDNIMTLHQWLTEDGLSVDRVSLPEARAMNLGCSCNGEQQEDETDDERTDHY